MILVPGWVGVSETLCSGDLLQHAYYFSHEMNPTFSLITRKIPLT